jgi:hypothetical protein
LFDNDVDAVLELVLPQPGPFTVEEIFHFCLDVVRTTLSSPHAGLFVENLKRRIELHTSYSGTGAEATALYWITVAARMLGLDADICNISFESACDTSPLCRRLLAAFEPLSLRPKVINTNILDKHPITVREELMKIAFSSRGADLPKIVDNVSKMNEMLSKHSIGKVRNLAAPSSTYESELDLTNPMGNNSNASSTHTFSGSSVDTPVGSDTSSSTTPVRPLVIFGGGMTCVDFCTFGAHKKLQGSSTLPCVSFLHDCRRADRVVLECAPDWADYIADWSLGSAGFNIEKARLCSSHFGWPMTKNRFWAVANSPELTDPPIALRDFVKLFHKSPMMTGHQFFVDDADEVRTLLHVLARRNGFAVGGYMDHVLNFEEHALDIPRHKRLEICREKHDTRREKKLKSSFTILPEALLCDLEQDPEHRERVSTTGYCVGIMCSASVWSDQAGRLMTKHEILSMLGYPTIPRIHGDMFPIPWGAVLAGLSDNEGSELAGNAMHMHVLIIVMCYVLATSRFA